MSHTVTISDPHQPDAMPMWESFDLATADDAYRPRRPTSRRHSPTTGSWTKPTVCIRSGPPTVTGRTHVATIVIAPSDDLPADPARGTQKADNA